TRQHQIIEQDAARVVLAEEVDADDIGVFGDGADDSHGLPIVGGGDGFGGGAGLPAPSGAGKEEDLDGVVAGCGGGFDLGGERVGFAGESGDGVGLPEGGFGFGELEGLMAGGGVVF